MRYARVCWPWQYAYAGSWARSCDQTTPSNRYESRWHSRGAGFGVRRPLRWLTHKLDLDESQVRRMASVLNHLKTEKDQAALDEKRTLAGLAELIADGTPTLEECHEALAPRQEASKRLNEETAKAVVAICELLDDDQREEFMELMLTGGFSL